MTFPRRCPPGAIPIWRCRGGVAGWGDNHRGSTEAAQGLVHKKREIRNTREVLGYAAVQEKEQKG
jgi:hypothetical protein